MDSYLRSIILAPGRLDLDLRLMPTKRVLCIDRDVVKRARSELTKLARNRSVNKESRWRLLTMTLAITEFRCPTCGSLMGEKEYTEACTKLNQDRQEIREELTSKHQEEMQRKETETERRIQERVNQGIQSQINSIVEEAVKSNNEKHKQKEALYSFLDIDIVVPIYHFMIESLNPNTVHLSRIKYSTDAFLKENHNYSEIIKAQKEIYHRFFYIDSIIKNLSLNNLITDFVKNQILVHYNFLSKFVHPTNNGLSFYQIHTMTD